MPRLTMLDKNEAAFLDMIAQSEIGADLLKASDDGYNVLVGSTARSLLLFNSYSQHPDVLNHAFDSTAAGRYQYIHGTWKSLAVQCGLPDFSPESQDRACIQDLKNHGVYDLVIAGDVRAAVAKLSGEWASLPGGDSGQHEQKLADLEQFFEGAGGTLQADA